MKTSALCLGAGLALFAGAQELGAQTVEVGDTPSFSFRNDPLQGSGIKSLSDLQGKPVLVEFWGTK